MTEEAATMRERIARAMEPLAWAALRACDTLVAQNRRAASLRQADRVLDAMLEPTDGMLEEGAYLTPNSQGGGGPVQPEVTRAIWQEMITAAKEGK